MQKPTVELLEERCLLSLSFAPVRTLPVPSAAVDVAVGDFNGDHIPDLAANYFGPEGAWGATFLGTGDGNFTPGASFYSGVQCGSFGLETADLTNDGKLDLVMAHGFTVPGCFGNKVTVHLGDGAGGFESPGRLFETGGSIAHFAVGDFDEDGTPDLAIPAPDQRAIYVFFGNGDGSFRQGPVLPYSGPFAGVDIVARDLTGDGHLDLALATGNLVQVFFGSGLGSFSAPLSLPVRDAAGITTGDFNGDGVVDLAVTSVTQGTVSVFYGTGGGSFSGPAVFPAVAGAGSLVAADFNGDGHTDLAVGSYTEPFLSVLPGDGHGGFGSPIRFAAGAGSGYRVRTADLNGDGLPDLIATNSDPGGVSILLNTSTQDLTATGTTITATAGQRFAAVVASFTDPIPGAATDYSATVDWGDDSPLSTGGISAVGGGNFDVAASHTYALPGFYTVTMTVTDNRSPDRSATAYTTVEVACGPAAPARHRGSTEPSGILAEDLEPYLTALSHRSPLGSWGQPYDYLPWQSRGS
jgi:hypothetical protein